MSLPCHLPRRALCATEDYVNYCVCCSFGDAGVYVRHLTRSKSAGNARATEILDAVTTTEKRVAEIRQLLQTLRMLGQERAHALCEKIIQIKQLHLRTNFFYSLCMLSGNVSTECFSIMDGSSEIAAVSERFRPFVVSLWVATHIADIEQCRAREFVASDASDAFESTSAQIEGYMSMNKEVQTEASLLYERCVQYASDVLVETTSRLYPKNA